MYLGEAFDKLCERMNQWGILVDKGLHIPIGFIVLYYNSEAFYMIFNLLFCCTLIDTKRRAVIRRYNMEGSLIDGLDTKSQYKLNLYVSAFIKNDQIFQRVYV